MHIGRTFEFKDVSALTASFMENNMGNRYLCDVLDEIRTCYKTQNYSSLLGLVEEAQTLANRMESSLNDKRNVLSYEQRRPILKDEITELEWKKAELEEEIRKLEFSIKETKHNKGIKDDS